MTEGLSSRGTCFFEQDPRLWLGRRATAEGVGTFLLMLVVTGTGLTTQRLWHGDHLPGLLVGALATAGVLIALIVAFGAVSGGHFNPLITALQWLAGERGLGCMLAYSAAQFAGAVAGAVVAAGVFSSGANYVVTGALNAKLIAGEALATAGLLIIVFGCSRSGKRETGPFAVGAWLAAAIIATPSTSYANPAVTIGSLFTVGPIALPLATVAAYLFAEGFGALAAFAIISVIYPTLRANRRVVTSKAAVVIKARS